MLIVLRHARAGPKRADAVRDIERPLDATGRATAIALPDVVLDRCTPSTIVSSPFLRCTQTVAPLARRLGLNVEERHELTPATSALACAALLRSVPDRAIVCTHGELIKRLFELECEKGAFWIVRRENGELRPVDYVAHPAAVAADARRESSSSGGGQGPP